MPRNNQPSHRQKRTIRIQKRTKILGRRTHTTTMKKIICILGHETFTSKENPTQCGWIRCNAPLKKEIQTYQKIIQEKIKEEKNKTILESPRCPNCNGPKSNYAFLCRKCSNQKRKAKKKKCKECQKEIQEENTFCYDCYQKDGIRKRIIRLKILVKLYERKRNSAQNEMDYLMNESSRINTPKTE